MDLRTNQMFGIPTDRILEELEIKIGLLSEGFVVKKRIIFGDKIVYRIGFVVNIGDAGKHKGYLVGKSLSDVLARSLKTMSRNFEDPLFDEQSSLLAMQ